MSEKMPVRAMAVCIMSTVAVTVTMGITLPYLALVQEGWGVDPDGMFLNPHLQAIFG